MNGLDGSRVFAVLDPHREPNREMIAALGTDAVELVSRRPVGPPGLLAFRVKVAALGAARRIRVCRLLARRNRISFDLAFVEAVQGGGISVCGHCCYICADPEVGREFFRARDRAGGP